MKNLFDDTICALSTVEGKSAIAVIRVSGPKAIETVASIFVPKSEAPIEESPGYRVRFGSIYKGEELLDEVLVSLFRAPNSYTGEEMVEISCHGSSYIQQEILLLLVESGARPARPGEFSQRAFLNGKLDLAQAEAVADLISSENEASHRIAINQMKGGFSKELAQMRSSLLDLVSLMELELDFAEEDVEFADRTHLRTLLDGVIDHIGTLIESFRYGNVIKNGIPIAIAGATNTGKSTLLNNLLKEERAIVSDIHGTTRDYIEGYINIEGVGFRFIDTAGIRESSEQIEIIGIERTFKKIAEASIILLLLDGERPENFEAATKQLASIVKRGQEVIVVLNKSDKLSPTLLEEELATIREVTQKYSLNHLGIVAISAKKGAGIEELQKLLLENQRNYSGASYSTLVSNIRHYDALREALFALERVSEGMEQELSTELLTQDIREAITHLGEIVGAISTNEILGNIFKNFCIGK